MNFSGKKLPPSDDKANQRPEIGMRVTAIMSAGDGWIKSLGTGTLVAFEGPPWDEQCKCPKIELDMGGTVWGHECFWWETKRGLPPKLKGMEERLHTLVRGETGAIVDVVPVEVPKGMVLQ